MRQMPVTTPDGRLQTAAMFALGLLAGLTLLGLLPGMPGIRVPGHAAWYGARAAGMVAYLLATASVLFGMAITTRSGNRLLGKANVADTHRALSLLSLFAIGAHMLFLVMDGYAKFSASDMLIPFATWYRPFWTGLGIISAYLAVAVYVSFYLRSLIAYRMWRTFHYASFAVFVLGTFHGLFAGTDTGEAWATALYGVCVASVAAMFAYRMSSRRNIQPREVVQQQPA